MAGACGFFRDVANITMDLNGVEHIQFNALGGADNITVNDLTGTDVTQVAIDLAAARHGRRRRSGRHGDRQRHRRRRRHHDRRQRRRRHWSAGLPAQVTIAHAEAGNDRSSSTVCGGNDTIDASALKAGADQPRRSTAATATTSSSAAHGDDFVIGGRGNDVALLGAGDDMFVWNPGDGSDMVEGQAGIDTLLFNGANITENIDISANGGRVRFFRDVANITMDLNGVEHIKFNALGGADNITVNDLTGTDVKQVDIDLGLPGRRRRRPADTIIINATNGDDVITVTNNNGVVTVSGLASEVTIADFERNDRIVINGLGGDDVIKASGLTAASMQFIFNGGEGNDVLHGNEGNDLLNGGAGPTGSNSPTSTAPIRLPASSKGLTRSGSRGMTLHSTASAISARIYEVGADVHIDLAANVAGAGNDCCRTCSLPRSALQTLPSHSCCPRDRKMRR